MTEASFDPEQHKLCESNYFEDLNIGQKFYIPSRTMTDALFSAFQLASGDNHPIHYDLEYCKRRGHQGLVAHGFQTLIQTAPGAGWFPFLVSDSLVGFLAQSSRFLKPVYSGDTLYSMLEIMALEEQRSTGVVTMKSTVYNQNRELVMDGEQKFLLKKRDPTH
jgi:acyl dehydratase